MVERKGEIVGWAAGIGIGILSVGMLRMRAAWLVGWLVTWLRAVIWLGRVVELGRLDGDGGAMFVCSFIVVIHPIQRRGGLVYCHSMRRLIFASPLISYPNSTHTPSLNLPTPSSPSPYPPGSSPPPPPPHLHPPPLIQSSSLCQPQS